MPKQINSPFPGSSLVRAFNLKGRFQPVLDETVVPVAIVTDLQTQGVGSGQKEAAGTNYNTSFVATSSYGLIHNPVDSGINIHVVDAHFVGTVLTAPAATTYVYGTIETYLTDDTGILTPGTAFTNEGKSYLDTRHKATQPIGQVIAGQPRQALTAVDLLDYDQYAWANSGATTRAGVLHFSALKAEVILSEGYSLCLNCIHLGAYAFHDAWSFQWHELSKAGGQP